MANGFVFLSLDDETGVRNAIVTPAVFDRFQFAVLSEPFLPIASVLQNVEGVVAVKAAPPGKASALAPWRRCITSITGQSMPRS